MTVRAPRLTPKAIWAGSTHTDSVQITDNGTPVNTTAATLTYKWRRANDTAAPYVVEKTEADATRGQGDDLNIITIPLDAGDTGQAKGTYIATWTIVAGGQTYIATREWHIEEAP